MRVTTSMRSPSGVFHLQLQLILSSNGVKSTIGAIDVARPWQLPAALRAYIDVRRQDVLLPSALGRRVALPINVSVSDSSPNDVCAVSESVMSDRLLDDSLAYLPIVYCTWIFHFIALSRLAQ